MVIEGSQHILIVDDCAEDRYIYRRYLEQDSNWTYCIQEAESGQDAIELCEKIRFDCILLDFRLPDLTGLEILHQLQTTAKTELSSVIVLTGQGSTQIAVQIMKAGAQDYLIKGQLTAKDLRCAVASVIEKAELRARLKAAEIERFQRIQADGWIEQISQQIQRSLSLTDLLQTTVDGTRTVLNCDRVLIFQFHQVNQGTVIAESVQPGWIALQSKEFTDPCFSESYFRRYQQGRVSAIADVENASVQSCYPELMQQLQVKANLSVPILQDQKLWGLFLAHHCATPHEWQPLEVELLSRLATKIGIAIKQAELYQQAQALEQAERANRLKDEFLAVLSHELRTPLSPILGWSRLLRSGKVDPARMDEALAKIERNAQLQANLIEGLLDVSRLLQGKIVLKLALVNLVTVAQSAIDTLQLSAEEKSIRLLFPNLAPLFVIGEAARLQQILWNLLSNAIKFTPEGGQVEVHLQRVGAYAQIQVIDTGKGIRADFLPHVFDYFQQEDSTTTRQFGGLGLGLAIVHQLVDLHGGSITAESAGMDQGSTFTIRLPVVSSSTIRRDESVGDRFFQNALLLPDIAPRLTGVKILVVEDDLDTREFITLVLQSDGAEVRSIGSALEVLPILSHFHPDVLISDIGMPEMDGYMLLRHVRLWTLEQIPAIALTAYVSESDRQEALEAGFQEHLAKPVDPTELVDVVARLMRSKLENSEFSNF